jgi:hypothetical protein
MKKEYHVFRMYNGICEGYLQVYAKNRHEITYKQYATLFTLKQANNLVFKLNKEMKESYSYARYGYERITE